MVNPENFYKIRIIWVIWGDYFGGASVRAPFKNVFNHSNDMLKQLIKGFVNFFQRNRPKRY